MPVLHVAFQEGFSGERVVDTLNGREVFAKDGIKTRTQIGLADHFDVEQAPGAQRLEVSVAGRGATRSLELRVEEAPTYVGVSLDENGQIRFRSSSEPFGYV